MLGIEFQFPDLNATYHEKRHLCQTEDMIDITDRIYDGKKYRIEMCMKCDCVHITNLCSNKVIDMKETPPDIIAELELDEMSEDDLRVLADRYTDDLKQKIFSREYKWSWFWFVGMIVNMIMLVRGWYLVTFCGDNGSVVLIFLLFLLAGIFAAGHLSLILLLKDYVRNKKISSPFPIAITEKANGKIRIEQSDKDMFYMEIEAEHSDI